MAQMEPVVLDNINFDKAAKKFGEIYNTGDVLRSDDEVEDCYPGYMHLDQRKGHKEFGDFAITSGKEDLSLEEWDAIAYS